MKYEAAYHRDDSKRRAFNTLSRLVFGLDFEPFYESGWWDDSFICHTLFEGNKAVSNVSVTKMRFMIRGREMETLQLGTVMTHPDYRGKGLARELMLRITKAYEGQASFRFLFANDSVTDFYPRYGFYERPRFLFSCPLVLSGNRAGKFRFLNLEKTEDRRILESCLSARIPVSDLFSLVTGESITLFHALYLFRDSLLFDEEENGILIVRQEGQTLHLYDAIYPRKISWTDYFAKLPFSGAGEALFHFTPETAGIQGGVWQIEAEEDDHFFVDAPPGLLPEKFSFPATGRT
ncbi:MAG TPA: GNAT family N-acetyltransferase [Candidatus Mcinerneyibacteriales bacterium]|nr:GNAT family N-acetyltransferase [Candidatus Mcinerneyibacteriales bacterium]HPQ89641.1 GNAT family N-acetyltransferase [Candidatus Mcinerneyibacteriales bacterium]